MSETTNTSADNLPPAQPPAQPPVSGTGPAGAAPPPGPRRRGGFARFLKWALVLVLLRLIGGGLFVYFSLDRIVKRTVETQATAQLNLKTELDGAHVSLLGGQVSLDDLRIASPEGFSAPQ